MSLAPNELKNLKADIGKILGFTVVSGVKWQNVVLAQKRAREWVSERNPAPAEERGGSSSPRELTERVEDRNVSTQALRDLSALPELIEAFQAELVLLGYEPPNKDLAKVAQRLAGIVHRCVDTVDYGTLPVEAPEGCSSCNRLNTWRQWKGQKVWQALSSQTRYAEKGLCSWCGKHGTPDIEFVAMRHRQGEHIAGRALAKLEADREAARKRTCGHPVWTGQGESPCGREAGHGGTCRAEAA